MKSSRNKTINTSVNDGIEYLNRCVNVYDYVSVEDIINKTIIGDTFSVCDYLPKQFVDLIIVDPPYNLTKTYGNYTFFKKSYKEYEQYTIKWLTLILPLLKSTGSLYVCCDWNTSLIVGPILCDFLTIRNRITWQREKGRGAKQNWKNGLEDIWFCTKSDNYTFNLDSVKIRRKVVAPYCIDGKPKDWVNNNNIKYRDTCPSNFWDDITIPFWSMSENTEHPTQKSEKLIAKIILASTNKGDIVFDPFLGSGTSSVVSKKLERNYIGIEQNQQYCIWTEQRLELANINTAIQGYNEGIFYERNYRN